MVRRGQIDLEGRMRSGHEELETRLDGELKSHEDRLDDVDERYEKSETALRLAEDAVGGVRGKVSVCLGQGNGDTAVLLTSNIQL